MSLKKMIVENPSGGASRPRFAIELEAWQTVRNRLAEQCAWISAPSKRGLVENNRCAPEDPLRPVALRFADDESAIIAGGKRFPATAIDPGTGAHP